MKNSIYILVLKLNSKTVISIIILNDLSCDKIYIYGFKIYECSYLIKKKFLQECKNE